jgi:2-aminophenol/2-amino-5-chlorophenol 1,6-dioxygenase beta subunit
MMQVDKSRLDSKSYDNRLRDGAIISGWLAPHPPHLVYAENPEANEPKSEGGWEVLRWAYQKCRQKIRTLKPDAIIVHTPHWQTLVGHHLLGVEHLKGYSVDPIFPHLFRYHYDLRIDLELSRTICDATKSRGLQSKLMTQPGFRVDYGTIVTLHLMNPLWDIPVVVISAHNSPYFFDQRRFDQEMIELGIATRQAVLKSGKRVILAASNSLSHRHFDQEPDPSKPEDMSREHIYSHHQYRWDMEILQLMAEGKTDQLLEKLPTFINETHAEVKAGSLLWMLSAMGFPSTPAQIHGYGSVIGTGNAVVEWTLNSP